MRGRATAWVVAVAGVALLVAGVATGALAAALLAPLGLVVLALSWLARGGTSPTLPPWLTLAGLVASGLGGAMLVLAPGAPAVVALASGATLLLTGAQVALAGWSAGPPRREAPAPLSLRTNLAVATDSALQGLWQAMALFAPAPRPEQVVEDVRAAADRNRAEGVLADPSLAHPAPPALEKVRTAGLRMPGLPPAESLAFESEFTPRDPEIAALWREAERNHTARAVLWRHPDGPRPALLCIHGYGMGRPALDARALDVPWLHREVGLDVALVTLPLHGARSLGRRSGAGFLDGHPLLTSAAFGQAVFELRRLAGWLRAQGAPAVGVTGMSLGGYTAALFASVERGLACAVPTIPAVALPSLLRRGWSDAERAAADAVGLSEELLRDAWASHDPLRHRPRVAPEGRLIVAGRVDQICPPEHALALWEHWERPPLHWFPGSHLVRFGAGGMRERLAAHLRATLVAAPEAPLPLTRFRNA